MSERDGAEVVRELQILDAAAEQLRSATTTLLVERRDPVGTSIKPADWKQASAAAAVGKPSAAVRRRSCSVVEPAGALVDTAM
jgi:hypothetical protein